MKKTVIASLAVLASAATLATFALAGAGKFRDVRANADPFEYSVTFDASDYESTTVEGIGEHWVFSTTTDNGNKVGVMGFDNTAQTGLSFRGAKFHALFIFDAGPLGDVGAHDFDRITGFTVVFDGLDLMLAWDDGSETHHEHLTSGTRFNVTCTPYSHPIFDGLNTTISSLTVHYTC